jgi:uncharacterized protein
MIVRFEWDPAKAEANVRKHGVSFEVATRVFLDPFHASEQDRIENGEYRWQTIGEVKGSTLLFVGHAIREDEEGEIIRIISARRATRTERRRYEQNG